MLVCMCMLVICKGCVRFWTVLKCCTGFAGAQKNKKILALKAIRKAKEGVFVDEKGATGLACSECLVES